MKEIKMITASYEQGDVLSEALHLCKQIEKLTTDEEIKHYSGEVIDNLESLLQCIKIVSALYA